MTNAVSRRSAGSSSDRSWSVKMESVVGAVNLFHRQVREQCWIDSIRWPVTPNRIRDCSARCVTGRHRRSAGIEGSLEVTKSISHLVGPVGPVVSLTRS